jgi:hypothetical protein
LYKFKDETSLAEYMKKTQCTNMTTEKHEMPFSQEIKSTATCMQYICICEIFSNHEIYLFTDRVRRNWLFLQISIIKDWKNKALDRNQCTSKSKAIPLQALRFPGG